MHTLVQAPPVVRHFTNWWYLSHVTWTTPFTCMFATSILWCYNFSWMIKWYNISCATLYITAHMAHKIKDEHSTQRCSICILGKVYTNIVSYRKRLWYPSLRVQTRPKLSDFSGEKILSLPSFRGEVKPSVTCRSFAACKKSLQFLWTSWS
jgi:hypothetical protein